MKKLLPATLALLAATNAHAGVGKVSSPEVNKGDATIEYSGSRTTDGDPALNNKQSHAYEFKYGLTDRWEIGVEAGSSRESSQGTELSGYGVEAQYELTNQGAWWLSSAIKGEYAKAAEGDEPDGVKLKLLASYERGPGRVVANLDLTRELGDNRDTGLALSSAVQATHEISTYFRPGLEWHADHGPVNDLGNDADMAHYLGPVIMGSLPLNGTQSIGYGAGYYWGLNDAAAAQAARLQVSYNFAF